MAAAASLFFFKILERRFSVQRSARYQQLGEFSAATRQLWLVAHGYGQLAEYFVRHFAPLHAADPAGTVVVAPEALSRFYLAGASGRVGASWMTRADRLAEIEDQVAYLTQLLASLRADCPAAVRITVLGFSQGTATVGRWLASYAGHWRPHQLVLWAGDFPPDIEPEAAQLLLHSLPVAVVAGDHDPYVSSVKLAQQAALLAQLGAEVRPHTFSGAHTLDAALLHQLHTAAEG